MALEKLTADDLKSLRLDEAAQTQFQGLAERMALSNDELHAFAGEDAGAVDDVRHEELAAAQDRASANVTAVTRFLAPRILRLRDGDAKRKWRSFLTRFQKEQKPA